MTPLLVTLPFAHFRSLYSSEYVETELLPSPATCYGFLLSMVGEMSRRRHLGARISPGYLRKPKKSVVYRWMKRVRNEKNAEGKYEIQSSNVPDNMEILSNVELLIWLDSRDETASPTLEERFLAAMRDPAVVDRFGGLCMGESQFLVNSIDIPKEPVIAWQFLLAERGRMSLPVWVDHVGGRHTIYVVGELQQTSKPDVNSLPVIRCDL
jgi:CRISPR-associated protein Cas5t